MAYRSPTAGAVGRTDEGVDFATAPGSAIRAIGAGVIEFVGRYRGFGSYIVERLSSGPAAGERVYYAEQASPTVRPRQHVAAGQQVGVAAGGLEVGFAQGGPSYLPLAQAEGGYFEGEATAAGRRFRNLLFGSGPAAASPDPSQRLEQLWIEAGGRPALARTMAAIALAESGGVVDRQSPRNADGSVDRGLWQVNSSHTQYDPARLLSEPLYNARAAVAIFNSQGLGAWTTYTSGAYRDYLGRADRATATRAPITRPGGESPADAAASAQDIAWYDYLNPLSPFKHFDPPKVFQDAAGAVNDVSSFLKWVAWIFHPRNILRVVEFNAGAGLIVLGLWTSVKTFEGSESVPGPARALLDFTPQGREFQAVRAGRQQAHQTRRREQFRSSRARARESESTRLSNRDFERRARREPGGGIPF